MTTLMQRGLDMVARELPKAAGGLVMYSDGEDVVPIHATFGQTKFQVERNGVVVLEYTDRDFIFRPELLILSGQLTEPKKGHRITVPGNDLVDDEIYEVLAPDNSQCFTRDPEGTEIRVFTKRINVNG